MATAEQYARYEQSEKGRLRRKRYSESEKGQANFARHRRKKREWLAEKKNRPCDRCGESFPPYVLEFHHRDPSRKLFDVGKTATRGFAGLEAEIAKCDLLCANCHRIVEHEEGLT